MTVIAGLSIKYFRAAALTESMVTPSMLYGDLDIRGFPAPGRPAVPGLRPRGNSLRPWRDHSVALHGIIPRYYDGSQVGPVAG